MSFTLADLVDVLDLDRIDDDRFRGRMPAAGWQRIFGGLVIAQALVAATRTAGSREPHSLHGYFLRPGDPAAPVEYAVTTLRDGRSFSVRRCEAIQHGAPIFTVTVSFQVPEDGLAFQIDMPDVPRPDALPSEADLAARYGAVLPAALRRYLTREKPIELRPVSLARLLRDPRGPAPLPVQQVWIRAAGRLPDEPALHCAVLGYLSDMTLLDTTLAAHGRSLFEPELQVASLDHALWFHRPARADEWLLYTQDAPSTSGARGLARGHLFALDGTLVASVAQEGLIREKRPSLPTN